jgi:hypothetical protein
VRCALLIVVGACSAPAVDLTGGACSDPARGPDVSWFAEVADPGVAGFSYESPDYRGAGLAVADLDGDGLPDVIAGSRDGGLALFHNNGKLHFSNITIAAGLDSTMVVSAIIAVDLDNDGDRDLVIAAPGLAVVMANQGDGTFVEAARFTDSGTTEQVLAVDLDGDGLLDLYFTNRDLENHDATLNRLYMNHGGLAFTYAGTFGDGLSWTTTAFDYDGDGDQDLYVANDTLVADFGTPLTTQSLPTDLLLRNDGVGSDGVPMFTDIAADVGLSEPHSSMSGLLGDVDGDGALDLLVTNIGAKKLYMRNGSGFDEAAEEYGVAAISRTDATCGPGTMHEDCLFFSWAALLTDVDLDGYDELLISNGITAVVRPPFLMFTRGDDWMFHEVSSPELGCMDARAMIATDLDGDGDQDLVVAPHDGPLVVFENRGTPEQSAWQRVGLVGVASNREGIGAVVTLRMSGGRTQVRVVGAGGEIHSSTPAEAFFGLGHDTVESVDVQWPSGRHTSVVHPPPGNLLVTEPG